MQQVQARSAGFMRWTCLPALAELAREGPPFSTAAAPFLRRFDMHDAIDELVARSRNCRELRDFHEFHNRHPEVLDFLVEEIQLRIDRGFPAFSFPGLWSYARWKLETMEGPSVTFKMNDHMQGFYSRAVVILYPRFNGRAEFRPALADAVFGTKIEPAPKKRPKNYARRLVWVTGERIEDGWRPSIAHTLGTVVRKPDVHMRPRV
jgi:hypothetical protein